MLSLLVLVIVVEVKPLNLYLHICLSAGCNQLLQPHQTMIVLIQQSEGFPPVTLNQTFVSLEVIVRERRGKKTLLLLLLMLALRLA